MQDRFQFGKNWANYLAQLSEEHLQKAQSSFESFTGLKDLKGQRFLDIGCGSGVHSWVAFRMGASEIVSFDYDADSVGTCAHLKEERAPQATAWQVLQGDILNSGFVKSLGHFQYVYSWGVLHHTGRMWQAIENALGCVAEGGKLHLAIYNHHWTSPLWKLIKWTYCHSPTFLQKAMLLMYTQGVLLKARLRHRSHYAEWVASYSADRGMRLENNLKDWLGGYPYEYATPEEIQTFVARYHFKCLKVLPNRGTGCSEFLFQKGN
jgi:2-polyprenyl-3-methyl-5-hydroxy-6-metoxy-1,4-benzoquinol methylase